MWFSDEKSISPIVMRKVIRFKLLVDTKVFFNEL